jgi:hypothetical protein
MSSSSLTLPYVVENEDRKKPFTRDIEAAAVLCLAESKRKKPGILGAPPEKLSLISKLHYPLWAVPWENECIIIDGLSILSHTIAYLKTPDVNLFVEDIKRNRSTRELFRRTLKSHTKTFEEFAETTQVFMKSIVANKEILPTILWYVTREPTVKKDSTKTGLSIPLNLDEKAVMKRAESLFGCWRSIQSEIAGLHYAINVLDRETEFHEQKIANEIEQISETFEDQISALRLQVEERVNRLTTELSAKIQSIFQITEKELKAALEERTKNEKKLEKLERDERVYQKRKQIRRSRRDEAGVTYWNHKIKVCKNKISEVKGKIKVLARFIERTRKQGELSAKKLEESYNDMFVQERKRISDLEAFRDSQIEETKREVDELESKTSAITEHIERLIDKKKLHASRLKETAIPWKPEGVTLITMPFYVFRYETDEKSRYHVHPPVIAMGYEGIIKKIQKTIWSFSLESRVKLLLSPSSRGLEEMFTSIFADRMRDDETLEKVVYEICSSNNLLHSKDFRETLTRGMGELKAEGWISREEQETVLKAYVH